MKILIVGGTGVISTSISKELLANGYSLTHYNRGQTPARFSQPVKTITGNRYDYDAFEQQMQAAGPFDCVIDMITYTPAQAESTIRAFRGLTKQLIFCSTVNVYTKPADIYPITEDAPRQQVIDDYGRNKAHCEDLFMSAHEHGDFNVTIMRPAHTYGDTGNIIHSLGYDSLMLDRMRKGKRIIVHGDGTAFWVTCHSDDVGHAFVNAIDNGAAYGNAYHVTGEEWLTWDRYHQVVAEVMGWPEPQLVHIPTDLLGRIAPEQAAGTVSNLFGNNLFDNTAAKRDLDFAQTILWREGARRTAEWLQANDRIVNSDDDPLYDRILSAWDRVTAAILEEFAGS